MQELAGEAAGGSGRRKEKDEEGRKEGPRLNTNNHSQRLVWFGLVMAWARYPAGGVPGRRQARGSDTAMHSMREHQTSLMENVAY